MPMSFSRAAGRFLGFTPAQTRAKEFQPSGLDVPLLTKNPCLNSGDLFSSQQMPQSFYCKACKLGFAVGWYHYHDSPDGYGAETLLVCSACGTMHSIQHPDPVFIPVLGGLFHKSGKLEKSNR